MVHAGFGALLLLAVQVISLPVTNPTTKDDTKVMKCIAEVISDTVSKPKPLPISQECLEILQGDERIRSILRHQNLLKELQEIAIQGANERTEQKKNSGFEDELSEVLESQSNKNAERDLAGIPDEEPTASLAEPEAEKNQKDSARAISKEEERNSLEEREPRARDPDDEKENAAGFESNEVSEAEELPWDDAVDNHIHAEIQEEGVPAQRHQQEEEAMESEEFEDEKEQVSKHSQEESNEEGEDRVREQAEEEEEEEEEEEGVKDEEEEEEDEEKERSTSEEEHPTSSEDVDDEREDDNQDAKGFEQDGKPSEEKEKYHSVKGERHHSVDETRQEEDTSHARDTESEEVEEEPSRDVEDAKRWNKMDELAKQLTTTKRAEENESNEDPDRSMKLPLRSHKYDFHNPEEDARRPQKHHSKEESSEGSFPLVPMPEEKKDEEGSANRRTEGIAKTLTRHLGDNQKTLTTVAQVPVAEQKPSPSAQQKDQELESLAAIEAELEKVAHKLHALRRG